MDLLQELEINYQNPIWNANVERRFSCVVCLAPKFRMVYGLCQHRICTSCGYEPNGTLKVTFRRCPTCQQENVFPSVEPNIPEDNITAQKLCGVRMCKYTGCGQEVWVWEKKEHELCCPHKVYTPKLYEHSGCNFNVRNKYSTITPKSSTRQQLCYDNRASSGSTSYSLRSKTKMCVQDRPTRDQESPFFPYNFRNRSARS